MNDWMSRHDSTGARVSDQEGSIAYYTKLIGVESVRRRAGYATSRRLDEPGATNSSS
jgi:hypothetical protein